MTVTTHTSARVEACPGDDPDHDAQQIGPDRYSEPNKSLISSETLREWLTYDQQIGFFVWIKGKRCGYRAGFFDDDGYLLTEIEGQKYSLHRLAWFYITHSWPRDEIDHINLVKTDNRFVNLREATRSQNQLNTAISARNTSGHKGVHFKPHRKKWVAEITVSKIKHYLGAFHSIEHAALAYAEAAQHLAGEFARLR